MLVSYIDRNDLETFKELYRNQFSDYKVFDKKLQKAIDYSLSLAGGGVRAQLVLATLQNSNLSTVTRADLSIAIEYFQLSSLILDDLPCMDDAEVRRGKPCLHKVSGESDAILVSLALINKAYMLLLRVIGRYDEEIQSKCMLLVDRCLGVPGIISGQAMDLNYSSQSHDEEYIEMLAELKTTSLFYLSMILPLIVLSKKDDLIVKVENFAKTLGSLYQLIDDLKDYYLESHAHMESIFVENLFVIGKKSRDKALDRPNFVYKIGEDSTHQRISKMFDTLKKHMSDIREEDESLGFYEVVISAMQKKYQHIVTSVS